MTDSEKIALRTYCSETNMKYGIKLQEDDPVTPLLFIIHEDAKGHVKKNNELTAKVEQAMHHLQRPEYHFHTAGSSFTFHLGKLFKIICYGFFGTIVCVGYLFLTDKYAEIEEARQLNETLLIVKPFLDKVKVDEEGNYFIDFALAEKGMLVPYSTFVKKDARTVRVMCSHPTEK